MSSQDLSERGSSEREMGRHDMSDHAGGDHSTGDHVGDHATGDHPMGKHPAGAHTTGTHSTSSHAAGAHAGDSHAEGGHTAGTAAGGNHPAGSHAAGSHAGDNHAADSHAARIVERHCDVCVIGGSAAGLAAALQLGRQRRSVIVVDSGEPRNAPATHMHGFLGREGRPPSELIAAGREEVRSYGGEILAAVASRVTRTEAGDFRVELDGGHSIVARRVLAATGLTDELPDIDGLAAHWGRDVIHCPFCHGYEVRDQRVVEIVTHPMGLHSVGLFRQLTARLTVVLHEPPVPDDPANADDHPAATDDFATTDDSADADNSATTDNSADADNSELEALRASGVMIVRGTVNRVVTGPDGHVAGIELARPDSLTRHGAPLGHGAPSSDETPADHESDRISDHESPSGHGTLAHDEAPSRHGTLAHDEAPSGHGTLAGDEALAGHGARTADRGTVTIDADAVVVGPRFSARAEPFAPLGLRPAPHPSGLGDIIETDATGATAVPGLYAAGNATNPSQQVLQAAADGSRVGAMISFSLAADDIRAAARPSGNESDWDHRYSGDRMWSGNPNGSLVHEVSSLTPGRALDVGAGEGGDALWLAERGWTVTASDISQRALDRVSAEAGRRGLRVECRHADANAADAFATGAFATGAFDLVSAQYASIPRTPDARGVRNVLNAVAAGGTLLIVSHDLEPMRAPSGAPEHIRPFDPDAYLRIDDFAAALDGSPDWDIELHEKRPRPPGAASAAHHAHDIVLRARRSAGL